MIDQSHNVTDPIESLITSAGEILRAYAQALLVDRTALAGYQESNDAHDGDAGAEDAPSPPTSRRSSPRRAPTRAAPSTRSRPIAPPATARRSPRNGRQ